MRYYLNPKILSFVGSTAYRTTIVAGRGAGKTHGLGVDQYSKYVEMPRSKGLLAGLNYSQLFNIVLPEMENVWNKLGLFPYDEKTKTGHYTIGKKPPAHWYRPIKKPHKSLYCVYFWNGRTIQLGSLDFPDSLRGGNYSDLVVDESCLIKEDDFNKVLSPMVRDSDYAPYSQSKYFNSIKDATSMPWKTSGFWVMKTETRMQESPKDYLYIEAKTRDNQKVLPKNYIKRLKETLSELEFMVEVENYRLKKIPNSFYPSFDDQIHCVSNTYSYTENEFGIITSVNNFYDSKKEIDLSFDFNAAFFSCIVGQEHYETNEYRIIDSLYADNYKTIDDLVDLIIDKYSGHKKMKINIYGDRGGYNRIGIRGQGELTFYHRIEFLLHKAGFFVAIKASITYPDHKDKHNKINRILSEKENLPVIRINQSSCKYLIISIQNAPITLDFKKDKSSERRLTDRRLATDFSDCFDYLIMKKFGDKLNISSGFSTDAIII